MFLINYIVHLHKQGRCTLVLIIHKRTYSSSPSKKTCIPTSMSLLCYSLGQTCYLSNCWLSFQSVLQYNELFEILRILVHCQSIGTLECQPIWHSWSRYWTTNDASIRLSKGFSWVWLNIFLFIFIIYSQHNSKRLLSIGLEPTHFGVNQNFRI